MFRKVATLGGGIAALDQSLSNITAKTTTGFFDAPLGLVLIQVQGATSVPEIELEVQAGDYKGVVGDVYINTTKKFGHRRA